MEEADERDRRERDEFAARIRQKDKDRTRSVVEKKDREDIKDEVILKLLIEMFSVCVCEFFVFIQFC